jgi:hypothetical protein
MFEEKPDYTYLRSLLSTIYEKFNYNHDYIFDWSLLSKDGKDEVLADKLLPEKEKKEKTKKEEDSLFTNNIKTITNTRK